MKYLTVLAVITCISFFSSCDSRDKIKMAMAKSFKEYIKNNDEEKNYKTNIKHVEVLSYEELPLSIRENEAEMYEAKVYFVATTSYVGSIKVYNINDTITSYFNKDLKMLRMINANAN